MLEVFGLPNSPLSILCILNFGIQWSVFVVSALCRTEKFFEVTGSYTFITLTYLSYSGSVQNIRHKIQAGMVIAWALRYGFCVLVKVLKTGKDRRFDEVKNNPGLFFLTWTLQGTWIFVTLLPTLILMTKDEEDEDNPLSDQDYIGYAIWTLGSFIEVLADYQKSMFMSDPQNKGRFITCGLWSLCRHPNYFGEALSWFGLYVSASSVFNSNEMLFVVCPIFDLALISKVRGIPDLERERELEWEYNKEYCEYVRRTALLVPYIW